MINNYVTGKDKNGINIVLGKVVDYFNNIAYVFYDSEVLKCDTKDLEVVM